MVIPSLQSPLTLPVDSAERKQYPLARGCLHYFPAALAGVARHSMAGNEKHNPGQELHHSRGKSTDHADALVRHLIDLADLRASAAAGDRVLEEANALAWRALALSQELHERLAGAPIAPGARTPEEPPGDAPPSVLRSEDQPLPRV